MTPHMAYWCWNDLPTTIPVGDISILRAHSYLAKRAAAKSDYPAAYWTDARLGLLEDSLRVVSPPSQADKRARALSTAWDQLPHGRKTAKIRQSPRA